MPNRIIKESIWTSPNLNKLSDMAERHFYRILPLPDDHGCFESTPKVVRGHCYPLKENVTHEDIAGWQKELEEAGLIILWSVNGGREYGAITSWKKHQYIRSLHNRKTPSPPKEVQSILDSQEGVANDCQQLLAIDNTEEENPYIMEGLRLKTGLAKLKKGELSKANEKRFKLELKKRGLGDLLKND